MLYNKSNVPVLGQFSMPARCRRYVFKDSGSKMYERAEIFHIDEEGILLRAYTEETVFLYDGHPEDGASPLFQALQKFYAEQAPKTLMFYGYETPVGDVIWQSELASSFGADDLVEVGERLYLENVWGERVMDEYAYEDLAKGEIPVGWTPISRDE